MGENAPNENKMARLTQGNTNEIEQLNIVQVDQAVQMETGLLSLNTISTPRFQRSRIHSLHITSGQSSSFFAASPEISPNFARKKEEIPDISKFESVPKREEENKVDDTKDDFKAFEEWLLSEGAQFPSLYLKTYSENVRGVHARVKIRSYETILYVPLNCLIHDKMGKNTVAGRIIFNPLSNARLSTPNLLAVVIYILSTWKDENHFFKPYYRILPSDYSNFPIFWDEEKLNWLQGSTLIRDIRDRLQLMRSDYTEICRVFPAFKEFSEELFLNIRTAVGSRNFGISIAGEKRTAMVPYADMLNHYRPRQTRWAYENPKEGFTIISRTAIYPGDQVMDSYGMKCNSKFFLHYGFAVENNREENGKCHNETSLRVSYNCQGSLQKVVILTDMFGLKNTRDMTLEREFKISMNFDATQMSELLSLMRIKNATENELDVIVAEKTGFSFTRRSRSVSIEPFSITNEIKVLKELYDKCEQRLSQYPLTYEKNKELLKSDKIKPFSDRRTALIIILSEQEIYEFWKQTYLTVSTAISSGELLRLTQFPKSNPLQRDIARYAYFLYSKLTKM